MHFYVCMLYAGSSDKAKVHGTNKDIGTQRSVQAGKQSNQVKTTNTITLNPVFVYALELKLEKFSEP